MDCIGTPHNRTAGVWANTETKYRKIEGRHTPLKQNNNLQSISGLVLKREVANS
jgi:hypothetical protein